MRRRFLTRSHHQTRGGGENTCWPAACCHPLFLASGSRNGARSMRPACFKQPLGSALAACGRCRSPTGVNSLTGCDRRRPAHRSDHRRHCRSAGSPVIASVSISSSGYAPLSPSRRYAHRDAFLSYTLTRSALPVVSRTRLARVLLLPNVARGRTISAGLSATRKGRCVLAFHLTSAGCPPPPQPRFTVSLLRSLVRHHARA